MNNSCHLHRALSDICLSNETCIFVSITGNCKQLGSPTSNSLIIVTTTDHFLDRWPQENCLKVPSAFHFLCIGGILTCPNCAVCEPLTSHKGGYASTMPLDTRLFSCGTLAQACSPYIFVRLLHQEGTFRVLVGRGISCKRARYQSSC